MKTRHVVPSSIAFIAATQRTRELLRVVEIDCTQVANLKAGTLAVRCNGYVGLEGQT
jgi:hypothetical protein